ncbi:PTS mannose transporter subunit IIAB [Ligilactobacillus pobuzihii]|uniref:PTS sugar transporter subunit IIA n=1 Tax=Ligilactobacillus pobuzihii TaxID=449659 RepID=UPI0019D1A13A|nr:fructose PTS transporter subunit IIA [Ligilactobacillus pobuzihii]MBN7275003.1 PTS mannose transporter subunit IIAB [Ligilactobacillus pobuzihii]
MELKEIIKQQLVVYDLESTTPKEVVAQMTELFVKQKIISNKEEFIDAVFKREKTGTTGIGAEIAIPHGQADTVVEPAVAIAKLKTSVEWHALDGKPVKYVFLLAIPKEGSTEHLQLLSQLAEALMDDDVRQDLAKSMSANDIIKIFKR